MNPNTWICLTRLFHSDCDSVNLEHFKYMIFKISDSWLKFTENDEEKILFDIWNQNDKLLEKLKHEISQILGLPEEWDISDLCKHKDIITEKDISIVVWTVGCLLQREIDIMKPRTSLEKSSWTGASTPSVTFKFQKKKIVDSTCGVISFKKSLWGKKVLTTSKDNRHNNCQDTVGVGGESAK